MRLHREVYAVLRKSEEGPRNHGLEVLSSYRDLTTYLASTGCSEDVIMLLLALEIQYDHRPSVLLKLHQRLCRLRRDRERKELLE